MFCCRSSYGMSRNGAHIDRTGCSSGQHVEWVGFWWRGGRADRDGADGVVVGGVGVM